MKSRMSLIVGFVALSMFGAPLSAAGPRRALPQFERIVVDDQFPGGYQVEVADINGDGKPDIVGVGGSTCAWYENPGWKKRVIATGKQTPGIISSASADLDGDGKAEVAIAYEFGMNEPQKGELLLASQGADADAPWTLKHIAHIGSIHRLRWGDVDGDGRPDLVVAPIFGPSAQPPSYNQSPARILVYRGAGKQWSAETVAERPVLHAIKVLDFDGDGRSEVLSADNLGVACFDFQNAWSSQSLVSGAPGDPPRRGSSEIHVGRLADGTRFLTTVEPWHGSEVAVNLASAAGSFGPRTVIDSSMKDGHALWVADVDGDGDDEIFAGYRGEGTSVLAFDFDGKSWSRTALDSNIAAQDLRGGDIDGDGTPDVVAIGGKTHNVVWYRPIRRSAASSKSGRGVRSPD